jgi:hypothetical protein
MDATLHCHWALPLSSWSSHCNSPISIRTRGSHFPVTIPGPLGSFPGCCHPPSRLICLFSYLLYTLPPPLSLDFLSSVPSFPFFYHFIVSLNYIRFKLNISLSVYLSETGKLLSPCCATRITRSNTARTPWQHRHDTEKSHEKDTRSYSIF